MVDKEKLLLVLGTPEHTGKPWNHVWDLKDAGVNHHLDISKTLSNHMKYAYKKNAELVTLTNKLGKIRLQYHLTDKL